ncbi:hypothetical protein HPB48_001995 [Haemaphysalis longicornis]|uniref:Kinesin-like protein n=1 Tax=Haemaphysalis longicornis TaxID=44386 RepID=A0A9J6FVE3_HAELO|nr:hypothetical protein HPB48_001995 [Haemaphysalis longicornis]
MEIQRKKRRAIRSQVTRIVKEIDECLAASAEPTVDALKAMLQRLETTSLKLSEVDAAIERCLTDEDADEEFEQVLEYSDKIANSLGRLKHKIETQRLPRQAQASKDMILDYHRRQAEDSDGTSSAASANGDSASTGSSASSQGSPLRSLLHFYRRELESRERAAESRPDDNHGKPPPPFRKHHAASDKGPPRTPTVAALHGTSSDTQCLLCQSKAHDTPDCNAKIDLREKKAILTSKGRCFRCTKRGHLARRCRASIECKACKRRHATTMCDPEFLRKMHAHGEETKISHGARKRQGGRPVQADEHEGAGEEVPSKFQVTGTVSTDTFCKIQVLHYCRQIAADPTIVRAAASPSRCKAPRGYRSRRASSRAPSSTCSRAIAAANSSKYLVHASYMEIYNEDVRDLLAGDPRKKLDLKEHPDKGVYVPGLSLEPVHDVASCESVMERGWRNRSVGATLMNADSSRSHSIFTIHVEQMELTGKKSIRSGKLNLVDLAGSERQTKTGASGERLREATKINLSLSALGNVISALVDGRSKHIPYRDSKLTRLLQDSLGGNTRTLMLACISPADDNYDETLSTLRYASRAKNIQNRPCVNEDPKDALLREYRQELERLKQLLSRGSFMQSPPATDGLRGEDGRAAEQVPRRAGEQGQADDGRGEDAHSVPDADATGGAEVQGPRSTGRGKWLY